LGVVLFIMAACTLTAPQAGSKSDLAGTSWVATGFDDGSQTVTTVLAGTTLTADFGGDGTLTGNSGCNDYSGPYKVTGDQIGIGPLSSTKKACSDPAGVMVQEAQYLAALQNAEVFVIDGSVLELREVDGTVMAKFTKNKQSMSLPCIEIFPEHGSALEPKADSRVSKQEIQKFSTKLILLSH
jgi:heat shock protein HslJ